MPWLQAVYSTIISASSTALSNAGHHVSISPCMQLQGQSNEKEAHCSLPNDRLEGANCVPAVQLSLPSTAWAETASVPSATVAATVARCPSRLSVSLPALCCSCNCNEAPAPKLYQSTASFTAAFLSSMSYLSMQRRMGGGRGSLKRTVRSRSLQTLLKAGLVLSCLGAKSLAQGFSLVFLLLHIVATMQKAAGSLIHLQIHACR